jgi:hypothetical protein
MTPKVETVYERAKRTGFISGADHAFARGPQKKAPPEKLKAQAAAAPKAKALAGPTLDELRNLVSQAVSKKFPPPKGKTGRLDQPSSGPWVKDLLEDHAIVERDGKLEAIPFEVNDGEVTLGEAFAVEQQYARV